MDRKEFNLMMSSYFKEALFYLYSVNVTLYNSSFLIAQSFGETDQKKQLELIDKLTEETTKNHEANNKYNEAIKKYIEKKTWVDNFVKIPVLKCPPENNDIPAIPHPFVPRIPVDNGEIKG